MEATRNSMTTVLIVDDESLIRDVLAEALADEGYHVHVACHGAEALAQAKAHRPAAVVLDMMMPVLDGLGFLRERATDVALAAVPVLALTAATSERLVAATEAGAEAILPKPFDLLGFLDQVQRLTATRG